jgi:hypothetical protein
VKFWAMRVDKEQLDGLVVDEPIAILEYKAKKNRIPHCQKGRNSMYFHMNFEPYRQCGRRCFCFVLQHSHCIFQFFSRFKKSKTLIGTSQWCYSAGTHRYARFHLGVRRSGSFLQKLVLNWLAYKYFRHFFKILTVAYRFKIHLNSTTE